MLDKKIAIARKVYTLIFVRDVANKKILLGLKKRGFGMNKWNGLGGKVEANETILEGAIREAKEESGLEISGLKQVAYLEFQFDPDWDKMMECHVFSAEQYKGEIRECEEIKPEWFNETDVPFGKMWKDDKFWLPHVISNKFVSGYFSFKADQAEIIEQRVDVFDTERQLLKVIKDRIDKQ